MKKRTKFAIRLFSIIIAVISFYYIFNHLDEFAKISQLKWQWFVILSAIFLLGLTVNGYLFRTLLRHFNIYLSLKEWLGLTVLNIYSNYLFVRGGPFVRGIYLKKVYKLSYINFVAIFIFIAIVQLFCVSILSLFSILFEYFSCCVFNTYLFVLFTSLMVISAMLFLLPQTILRFLTKYRQHLSSLVEEWLKIRRKRNFIIGSGLLIVIWILLSCLRIFLIYGMIFEAISFPSAIIIGSMGFLSLFILLTPGSLGIKEALMSYTAKLLGGRFAEAAVVASLDRAVAVIWIFILGLLFSIWYSRKMR